MHVVDVLALCFASPPRGPESRQTGPKTVGGAALRERLGVEVSQRSATSTCVAAEVVRRSSMKEKGQTIFQVENCRLHVPRGGGLAVPEPRHARLKGSSANRIVAQPATSFNRRRSL